MITKQYLVQALEALGWRKVKTENNTGLDLWVNPQETEIVHLPTKKAAPDYQRCLDMAASMLQQAEREPLAAWVDRITTSQYEYAVQFQDAQGEWKNYGGFKQKEDGEHEIVLLPPDVPCGWSNYEFLAREIADDYHTSDVRIVRRLVSSPDVIELDPNRDAFDFNPTQEVDE